MALQSHITKLYQRVTGIAFLVIYLVGFGLATYPSLLATSEMHGKHMHCTDNYCCCSHEADKCDCHHMAMSGKQNQTSYKECDDPISESFTGISISPFLIEDLFLVNAYPLAEYFLRLSKQMSPQINADAPFPPPQFMG